MKKRILIVFFVMAVVLLSFTFLSMNNSSKANEVKQISTQTNGPMKQQKTSARSSASSFGSTQITTTELQSFKNALPSKEQIEKDHELNPHTPSPTLMNFAKELSPLMEKAIVNESDAQLLMGELNSCALNEATHNAAKALCVQDSEMLTNYHPQLKSKAKELRANVSPEVQKILDINDAFVKE